MSEQFLRGVIPTAENVCLYVLQILKDKIKDADLYKVKLFESEKKILWNTLVNKSQDQKTAQKKRTDGKTYQVDHYNLI